MRLCWVYFLYSVVSSVSSLFSVVRLKTLMSAMSKSTVKLSWTIKRLGKRTTMDPFRLLSEPIRVCAHFKTRLRCSVQCNIQIPRWDTGSSRKGATSHTVFTKSTAPIWKTGPSLSWAEWSPRQGGGQPHRSTYSSWQQSKHTQTAFVVESLMQNYNPRVCVSNYCIKQHGSYSPPPPTPSLHWLSGLRCHI